MDKLKVLMLKKDTFDTRYVNHATDGTGTEELEYIDFDVTATSGDKVGRLRWNDTDRCLEYDSHINGSIATNQIGQEVWVRVRNNTGVEIADGKAVYITGAIGNRPTIALADMSVHQHYQSFVGITTEAIPKNDDGFVTTIGSVRGLNTNGFEEGDELFVSATTAGEIVNVRPDAPNHIISIGTVSIKNPSVGEIVVKIEKQQIAKDVPIEDTGSYYTGTEVETALQELGAGTTLDGRYVNVTGDTITGTINIGDATNYAEIKEDGEINLHGTARVYKNEWITVSGLQAPGTKPAAYVDWGINGGFEFSDGTDDTVVTTIRLPIDMDKTVAPEFKIGWASATADPGDDSKQVVWQLEYLYVSPNEDTTASAQETLTTTTSASTTTNGLTVSTITGMDLPSASEQLLVIRLKRLGADGDDDLGDDCTLVGCGLSYVSDKLGVAT